MTFDIPDKRYFKIGEVSKLADVAPHVVRYWETEFSGIMPMRAASNQRLYRQEDVQLILKIKILLHVKGYTIAGAKQYLLRSDEEISQSHDLSPLSLKKCLGLMKTELLQLYKALDKKNPD